MITPSYSWLTLALFTTCLAWSAPASAEPDAWITTRAKMELWNTKGVRSAEVHVDTINGEVTLHGKVATDEQKENAQRAVIDIAGVSKVHNLLHVIRTNELATEPQPDARIKEGVEQLLTQDLVLKAGGVHVKSVADGVVLLAGKTKTYIDHLTAIEAADSVFGVRQVSSEIVAPRTLAEQEIFDIYLPGAANERKIHIESAMNDLRITTEVKLLLLADIETPSSRINVDTLRGSVLLFGMVDDEHGKSAAEADAHSVRGVREVHNELVIVTPSGTKSVAQSDAQIKTKTQALLEKYGQLGQVQVTVKDGVVSLTAKGPTRWDKLRLATLTRASTGARAVKIDLSAKK